MEGRSSETVSIRAIWVLSARLRTIGMALFIVLFSEQEIIWIGSAPNSILSGSRQVSMRSLSICALSWIVWT